MGGIVDSIVDIISNVVDAIVDIIETIVEVVVDIVESVVDIVAGILGFDNDDQTVEQFEVHNQALFDDPDRNLYSETLYQTVIRNEDITANLLYDAVFRSGKNNLRQFIKYIDDGNYFESFPTVHSAIMAVDYGDVTAVLNSINSTPCTINNAALGSLFIPTWVKYWLQENKGYSKTSNSMGVVITSNTPASSTSSSFTSSYATNHWTVAINDEIAFAEDFEADERWYVDLTNIVYNTATDDYTINVYRGTLTDTMVSLVPSKGTGVHYIINYYIDSDPLNELLFIYKVGAGTYTDLDDPSLDFDATSTALQILPAIPIRLNNTNFNDTTTTKSTQIQELCEYLGIEADEVIDAVMEDVATAGITDYENKVDHVFINFGVRIWDTSQAGMRYMFKLSENMYANQAVTEATYNSTPASDEKPYNQILVTAADYKYVFKYSYITFNHYTKATVDSDTSSVINGVYYSDMSRFDSSNILIQPYYVSSGKATYNIGYKADNLSEVNSYVSGSGVAAPGTPSSEASSWLQVTQRITYGGTLYDRDGVHGDNIMKPDAAFYMNGSQLTIVTRAEEETTNGQKFTFYQVVANGLNEYTLHAPIAMLRVVDAATTKFKMVKFNIANQNDLMVPFSYDLVKDLPNSHVSSLFMASAHISLYVAHYEVVEVPFWAKLLKIISVILIIIAIVTFNPATFKLDMAFIKKMVTQMIIKKIVVHIASKISPELAMIVGAYLLWEYGGVKELDFSVFADLAQLFSSFADIMNTVITVVTEEDLGEIKREATYEQAKYDAEMKDLAAIRKDLRLDYKGEPINLVNESIRGTIRTMSPVEYLAYYENFNQIGFMDYDYEQKINSVFDVPQYA